MTQAQRLLFGGTLLAVVGIGLTSIGCAWKQRQPPGGTAFCENAVMGIYRTTPVGRIFEPFTQEQLMHALRTFLS